MCKNLINLTTKMVSISLLGTKVGMTQIFNSTGSAIPVTVLQLGPCLITQIKTTKSDGYNAIQLGYLEVSNKKLSKAELGHLQKTNTTSLKYLKEYRVDSSEYFNIGQTLTTENLKIGDFIDVSGKSIGKGFSGYQKRHHFSRGPMSHGSKNHRQPGSIGAGTTPGRVFPGKKMAGRMGGQKVTIKNLQIIDIHTQNHIILIKGSVPGKPGSLISIKTK
uniref:Large ribosomal subunit protein uL3c n=1 Tax=Corallina officinalis TaxID=35170 RepID=A0A6M3WBI7_COROI|nr:50S ribosomal protein L3 [Corallina officinalis]QJF58504.1 50S ribosomal protein L3 [Corallina officinalis]QJF58703.1 50S ribosomal protein L3 [Corallina officinalis]QJF58902.1 50S ribosomal protein L3 [Corallina officinalis]